MTLPSLSACRALRRRLLYYHEALDFSWHALHDVYFPGVPAGTLCTIAKGGKIPAKHWKALGLIRQVRPQARTQAEETIIAMSMMARQGLRNWKRRK